MLFVSGTRDRMADYGLMCTPVESRGAQIRWLETADHGYRTLKRTRTSKDAAIEEMASNVGDFFS